MSLNEHADGLADLQKAQSLSPNDKYIRTEITRAMKIYSIYKQKESKMFKKMFT